MTPATAPATLPADALTFAQTLCDALEQAGWLPSRSGGDHFRRECPLTGLEAWPLTCHACHLRLPGVPGLRVVASSREGPTRAALDVAVQLEGRRRAALEERNRCRDDE